MRKFIPSFSLITVIFLNGCGPRVVPVAVQGGLIDERRGSLSITREGITVTAEAEVLYRTPYNLEDYFTPFRVVVRNETGHDVSIKYNNFILFDEKGNQYNAYSPKQMADIVKSDPDYVVQPPVIAVPVPFYGNYSTVSPLYPSIPDSYYAYGAPYYDRTMRQWVYPGGHPYMDRRRFTGETLMQDIFLTALPVGRVVSGAQVAGNVYFRADMREVSIAKVRVTVNGVEFELPFLVK